MQCPHMMGRLMEIPGVNPLKPAQTSRSDIQTERAHQSVSSKAELSPLLYTTTHLLPHSSTQTKQVKGLRNATAVTEIDFFMAFQTWATLPRPPRMAQPRSDHQWQRELASPGRAGCLLCSVCAPVPSSDWFQKPQPQGSLNPTGRQVKINSFAVHCKGSY